VDSTHPLPTGWFLAGSHPELGADSYATYTFRPSEALPPLDSVRFDGSFSWLTVSSETDSPLAFEEPIAEQLRRRPRLEAVAAKRSVAIPGALWTFLARPELHGRVPTCTACYLDLSEKLLDAPGGGHLLRFMNDQQACLLWYLHLRSAGEHTVVVGAPSWLDEPRGETLDDAVVVSELVTCASSFEEFVYRFWMENTLWFCLTEERALSPEQSRYLAELKRRRAADAGQLG
jgi:hypothetical protein